MSEIKATLERPYNIILTDDDRDHCEEIKLILEMEGFNVIPKIFPDVSIESMDVEVALIVVFNGPVTLVKHILKSTDSSIPIILCREDHNIAPPPLLDFETLFLLPKPISIKSLIRTIHHIIDLKTFNQGNP